MGKFSVRQLKLAILEILRERKNHRFNMLGRGNDRGEIERRLEATFEPSDRQLADLAFQELMNAGLVASTFTDLVDPANWVELTDAGRGALECRALDDLDVALAAISPHLVEMRAGAWAAIHSNRSDAVRQAAHSGRELLAQTLSVGAPDHEIKAQPGFVPDKKSKTGVTRRHRLKFLMMRNHVPESNTKSRSGREGVRAR